MNDRIAPIRREVALALAISCGVVFGLVVFSGNLTAGHRIVDDNQLYQLSRLYQDEGFLPTATDHMINRTFTWNRLVPVFLVHKLTAVRVLGTNLTAWSIYIAGMGALAMWILYLAMRAMEYSRVESVGFVTLVTVGQQSVLWWRLLHGEGPAMFFLSVALYTMARGVRSEGHGAWDVLFAGSAIVASLCKESFILLMPALCFWRMWLARRRYGLSFDRAWQRDRALFYVLLGVMVAELLFIKFVLAQTHFHYTGWRGFSSTRFARIVGQLFSPERSWPAWAGLGAAYVAHRFVLPRGADVGKASFAKTLWNPLILAGLIVAPQMLLYLRSGFEGSYAVSMGRFLVPTTFGLAIIAIEPIRAIRLRLAEGGSMATGFAGTYRHVCTVGISIIFVYQAGVAWSEGTRFADFSDRRAHGLDLLGDRTAPEHTIAIVYDRHTVWEARRWSIFLTERIGRDNLMFLAIDRGRGLDGMFERFRTESSEGWGTTHFYNLVEGRSMLVRDCPEPPDAVVVLDGKRLEEVFTNLAYSWMHPGLYEREAAEYGEAVFFKHPEPPEGCEPAEPLPSRIVVEDWEDDSGFVSLTGHVLSVEEVSGIRLTVGGEAVPGVRFPLVRGTLFKHEGEYPTLHCGFEKVFYRDRTMRGEPVVLEAFGPRGTLASVIVEDGAGPPMSVQTTMRTHADSAAPGPLAGGR